MARRFAAFLRGINVTGRRVTGADLAAAFEAADGIEDASSFIASGNVVFTDTTRRGQPAIAKAVEAAMLEAFGWESRTFLRDADELAALAGLEPFTERELAASRGKPQVTLYGEQIGPKDAAAIEALSTPDDRLVVDGRDLHWLPIGGISESGLDLAAIDKLLGPGTTRTANTIRRLHAKYFAPGD
jgi:uncharacterized protein (DUF1697 family)